MELRRCFNEVDGDHDGQIDVLALVRHAVCPVWPHLPP